MSLNTMEYAAVFMQELDSQMVENSTSGWMEANAGQVQYSGGAEVKIPKMQMSGLGNYDRENGFVKGGVTVAYETRKLTQDRGRAFQVDAMDVDETNFAAVAGNVMGEFQRTKVIPEIDAYRYSAIAAAAAKAGKQKEYTPAVDTIWQTLLGDITQIRDVVGDGAEIVITMSAKTAGMLDQAKGDSQLIQSGEFVQGGVHLKVKEIDQCPVIRVPSARLKTKYDFNDGVSESQEDGGFAPAADAKDINWIIAVRHAPIAVSKTDVTRIFDPMTNQSANAWKIDYRKYHDLWITDNGMEGILVSVNNA
ncbi:hypothetical protein H9X85_03815 [Anaerotignum lactatifermentans]|uniref:Capsid protein n=1 Tax=Anaerotignum lactatifermentans TaxID=160404 RepID=A0ABS2G9B1_9FIRM|nr:hypothetical protein [Anaerotignum lactatifermentans]MBM6828757.1 hypothetical protein [Anaerotignum lactatifermentans]MBM6877084.1 hypothetical protein [Anaerotignum lactatifermentans]MBM6950339.1 hypothetical protein [Anaerotignum lactatifermentans]